MRGFYPEEGGPGGDAGGTGHRAPMPVPIGLRRLACSGAATPTPARAPPPSTWPTPAILPGRGSAHQRPKGAGSCRLSFTAHSGRCTAQTLAGWAAGRRCRGEPTADARGRGRAPGSRARARGAIATNHSLIVKSPRAFNDLRGRVPHSASARLLLHLEPGARSPRRSGPGAARELARLPHSTPRSARRPLPPCRPLSPHLAVRRCLAARSPPRHEWSPAPSPSVAPCRAPTRVQTRHGGPRPDPSCSASPGARPPPCAGM